MINDDAMLAVNTTSSSLLPLLLPLVMSDDAIGVLRLLREGPAGCRSRCLGMKLTRIIMPHPGDDAMHVGSPKESCWAQE